MSFLLGVTVDGSEILHQLRSVVYPIIYQVVVWDLFHQQYVQNGSSGSVIYCNLGTKAPELINCRASLEPVITQKKQDQELKAAL